MLSGLFKSRQSIDVGGPIGSMADAKSDAPMANPDYTAAYLAKRLTKNADKIGPQLDKEIDRYRPGDFTTSSKDTLDFDQAEKTAFLLNSVKDYEAEAEECLKKEFKDWLSGRHQDNAEPQPYDNNAGGMKRRDMRGELLAGWHPTWWGTKQLTHLPGVREYLREDYSSQDKHSFDMNMLAQFGPSNLEEAWAYFKYWVKRRPVGPWKCLTEQSDDKTHPFERSGPFSMAPGKREADGTMPEMTRREAGNPSLLDQALKDATTEATAEEAKRVKAFQARQTKQAAKDKQALADAAAAQQIRDDPYQTPWLLNLVPNKAGKYEHIHKGMTGQEQIDLVKALDSEYQNRILKKADSGAEVTWRELMKDRRVITRDQYERAAIYTNEITEGEIVSLVMEAHKLKDDGDISEADRDKILSALNRRKGGIYKNITYSDHYNNDQLAIEEAEKMISEAKADQAFLNATAAQNELDQIEADRKTKEAATKAAEAQRLKDFQDQVNQAVQVQLAGMSVALTPEQLAQVQAAAQAQAAQAAAAAQAQAAAAAAAQAAAQAAAANQLATPSGSGRPGSPSTLVTPQRQTATARAATGTVALGVPGVPGPPPGQPGPSNPPSPSGSVASLIASIEKRRAHKAAVKKKGGKRQ